MVGMIGIVFFCFSVFCYFDFTCRVFTRENRVLFDGSVYCFSSRRLSLSRELLLSCPHPPAPSHTPPTLSPKYLHPLTLTLTLTLTLPQSLISTPIFTHSLTHRASCVSLPIVWSTLTAPRSSRVFRTARVRCHMEAIIATNNSEMS